MENNEVGILQKRLANLQTVTGLVIHTLNNLISGMYGMAQLAQATGKPEYSEKTVEMAGDSCKRIKNLLQEYSEYSCGVSKTEGSGLLSRAVEKSLAILGRELEKKKIFPETHFQEGLRTSISEADIQELVYHLLRGAIESIKETGTIAVDLYSDGNICLVFTDSGVYIPEWGDMDTSKPPESEDEHVLNAYAELLSAFNIVARINGEMSVTAENPGKKVVIRLAPSTD